MKDLSFITAREEKLKDAFFYLWFAIGWMLLTVIVAVIMAGGLKACISGSAEVFVIGGGGAGLCLLAGAVTWLQGKLALRERRQIVVNGCTVTGIVTDVESEIVWTGRGRKTQRYRVVVDYHLSHGEKKTWRSPRYKLNPYDYVGVQQECKLYVWGEKCCLADVPPRQKPTLEKIMGKYAFLARPMSEAASSGEAPSGIEIKREKSKRDPLLRQVCAKDLARKYRIEDFKTLDKESLEKAKTEWSGLSLKETDRFLCFRTRILRQAKPIGHFEVFLEVRFISKRICSFSTRYAMEQDFDECIKELNFRYSETDYEFLKEQIQTRMEALAKEHFGRIPVTEVLVELL